MQRQADLSNVPDTVGVVEAPAAAAASSASDAASTRRPFAEQRGVCGARVSPLVMHAGA